MSIHDSKRISAAIQEDLDRLTGHVSDLIATVGGSIGHAVGGRIEQSLESARRHLDPLITLLGGIEGDVGHAKRGTGRPRKDATASAPAPRGRRRRGGRGRRANLTAEQIQDALKQANGIKARAARLLSVSSMTFDKYLKATSVPVPTKRGRPSSKK